LKSRPLDGFVRGASFPVESRSATYWAIAAAAFAQFIASESAKWGRLIADTGIKGE
jgi:hypothetical protein